VSVQAQLVLHRFDRFVDPAAKRLVLTVRSSQRAEVERESVDVYRHALLQASLTRENHKNAGKKENRAGTFGFLVTLNKHERCEPSRRRIQGIELLWRVRNSAYSECSLRFEFRQWGGAFPRKAVAPIR